MFRVIERAGKKFTYCILNGFVLWYTVSTDGFISLKADRSYLIIFAADGDLCSGKGRKSMSPKTPGVKQVAANKKAYHDYFIDDKFEAGIELFGTEVKSIRQGNINLKDSFCTVKDGELFVHGMHISPYEKGNIFNKDPVRNRRLLMHKKEINRLYMKIKQDGLTLVPLSVYFKNSLVKVEIGLARGKKLYDKRASSAEKDAKREIDRSIKERNSWKGN